MNRTILFALLASSHVVLAQTVTLPYNPDANQDSVIGTPDLLTLLQYFGEALTPGEVLINEENLTDYVAFLAAAATNATLDTALVQTDGSVQVHLSNGNAFQLIFGCTDSNYTEYEASVNTDDGSCVTLVVVGCTDSGYTEFNPEANSDDGTCMTLVVTGCTDPVYLEYNAEANTDDGSCSTVVIEGCTDSAYLEYNAEANTDDGSCSTVVIEGCTDPADVNYNADANTDDGSCSCNSIEFDGYTYSVVEIGDQCWFAENLRTTVYADGSSIPWVLDNSAWAGLGSGARCDYVNDASNVATYGRLYNWFAVNDARGLCPAGWHVPTDSEWTNLNNYIISQGGFPGGLGVGTALKSTSGWFNSGNGTDDFGFSAFPGGMRFDNGHMGWAGYNGSWWSSSPIGSNAWHRDLSSSNSTIMRWNSSQKNGHSVRCVRVVE